MRVTKLLDAGAIDRSLRRMAHEILERHHPLAPLCFIGIQTRGVPLATRLGAFYHEFDPARPVAPTGSLDVSFHRDDLQTNVPIPKETTIPFDLSGRTVILVDDVLFTGRTVRAALNAMIDLGRAGLVELAVLVDRGHRQLPIRADYVGKNVPTALEDKVVVHLQEHDGKEEAFVLKGGA
jgi:pyrimidine operon attenuation protein/uracil phosphoribosyltransferase